MTDRVDMAASQTGVAGGEQTAEPRTQVYHGYLKRAPIVVQSCGSRHQCVPALAAMARNLDRSFHITPGTARVVELNHQKAELRVLAHEVHDLMACLRLCRCILAQR